MAIPIFYFVTDAYKTGFEVVSFKGEEQISRLFKYVVELKIADSIDVNEQALVDEDAIFTFEHNDKTSKVVEVSGILSTFEYISTAANYDYYRATLVPACWKESLGVDFEIFLNMTPKEIIEEVISDAQINANTSGVQSANYSRNFTCQYNESNFDFISRIAEHSGIYYYFNHENDSEIVFADDKQYPSSISPKLQFNKEASGEGYYNTVHDLKTFTNVAATYLSVRDSNPDSPSVDILGEAGSKASKGTAVNLVEEDVATSEEASYIANIRFEQLQSESAGYKGKSGVIQIGPGYKFDLNGHSKSNLNGSYLVVSITHEGNNLDGLASDAVAGVPYYQNSFEAKKSTVQFRPQKATTVPQAMCTLGTVYSEVGDPRLAERNEKGEYRVRFRFLNDEAWVKASYWLRMGSLAAGAEDTVDIPLKGGVEVQIGFENGNPNKPYIQSAMPNAKFPSHVTASNLNNALISTSGMLGIKANGGWYRNIHVDEDDWDNPKYGSEEHYFRVMTDTSIVKNTKTIKTVVPSIDKMTSEQEMSGKYIINRLYGDQYTWADGINYEWDNKPTYSFGNGYDEIHENDQMSILNRNADGNEYFDLPYMPDDKQDRDDGLIEKVWGDKFEYFKGRTYAWSGGPGPGGSTQTYNYGNGYTENLVCHSEKTARELMYETGAQDLMPELGADGKEGAQEAWAPAHVPGMTGWVHGKDVGVKPTQESTLDDIIKARQLYPGSTLMERTYGGLYSYHAGFSVDIRQGDSVSKTYGDSQDYVKGNSESVTHGDAHETVYGTTNTMFLGFENELKLSGSASTQVGFKSDIFVGGSLEIELAAKVILSATAEGTIYNRQDNIAASEASAALSTMEASLKADISALKLTTSALQSNVQSTIYNLTAGKIAFQTMIFTCNAALTKIG